MLPDLLGRRRRSSWWSRGGSATAAAQLLDEEAALAETLAATWGARDSDEDRFPRLHVPFERLLSESRAGVVALPTVPEGPSTPALAVRPFRTGGGRSVAAGRGRDAPGREGYSVTLCAATGAGAGRLSAAWPKRACTPRSETRRRASREPCVVAAPLANGFILPDAKVAVLSETDVTGRRVPHRRAKPRARAADGFFDDLEVGSFVVHRQHGVARFEGVTSRRWAGPHATT